MCEELELVLATEVEAAMPTQDSNRSSTLPRIERLSKLSGKFIGFLGEVASVNLTLCFLKVTISAPFTLAPVKFTGRRI